MGAQLKFYARGTTMKNLDMDNGCCRIFDSDFCYSLIEDSYFGNVEFNNCDVSYASFINVSFEYAALSRLVTDVTRFTECDFTKAWLYDFAFDKCIFEKCDFSHCDMSNVTFKSCSFYDCDFEEADLPPFFHPSTMEDCINVPYMPMACPEEGEFIGYKIASSEQFPAIASLIMPHENLGSANVLVTLKIPADARRSSAGGRKCRCDKAEVIGLEHVISNLDMNVAYSKYDARFVYRVGEKISVPFFDENRWHECASGIHFFINRKEALQYYGLL